MCVLYLRMPWCKCPADVFHLDRCAPIARKDHLLVIEQTTWIVHPRMENKTLWILYFLTDVLASNNVQRFQKQAP